MKIGILGAAGRMGRALVQLALGRGHDVVEAEINAVQSRFEEAYAADATVNFAPISIHMIGAQNSYFDASECASAAKQAHGMASVFPERLYVPNCGLAPGAVNILAAQMLRDTPGANRLSIYCGALPADRRDGYAVIWSPAGLARLYREPVTERENGLTVVRPALSALELTAIRCEEYESFATAGGLGTLLESFPNLPNLAYRTLRYPGHKDEVAKVKQWKAPLAEALAVRWPDEGKADRVIMSIVAHKRDLSNWWYREIEPRDGLTAIQRATAAGLLAAIEATVGMTGYVRQEDIPYGAWYKVWSSLVGETG